MTDTDRAPVHTIAPGLAGPVPPALQQAHVPIDLTSAASCTAPPLRLLFAGTPGRGRAASHKYAVNVALRRHFGALAANALVGTVSVERRYPRGHQAVCTCGHLTARRRLLRGFAVSDAYIHAAQTRCVPAEPLFPALITSV